MGNPGPAVIADSPNKYSLLSLSLSLSLSLCIWVLLAAPVCDQYSGPGIQTSWDGNQGINPPAPASLCHARGDHRWQMLPILNQDSPRVGHEQCSKCFLFLYSQPTISEL